MVVHQNNLNFLRFILASLVILGHAYALTDPGNTNNYWGHFEFSALTALSVNAFFVISGYLIYHSLMHARSYRQYAASRILRIVPLFEVVIVLTVLLCSLFYTPTGATSYWEQSSTWNYLTRNLSILGLTHYINGVFTGNPETAVNGSLWSIPYEIICYILFSILFFVRNKQKLRDRTMPIAYTAVVILYLAVHVFGWISVGGTVATLIRCVMLFFNGMMIARYINPQKISWYWAVVALVLFSYLYFYRTSLPQESLYMLSIFPLSMVVMYLGFVKNSFLPQFERLGDASYGIYLMGFPVQQMLIATYPHWHPVSNALATFAIVYPLAFASWHFFEKPILMLKKKVR